MDILTISITIIVSLTLLHVAAFFAIRTMYPPFTQPTVIEQHVEPVKEIVPVEAPREEAVVAVPVIPSEEPTVSGDSGVVIPDAR